MSNLDPFAPINDLGVGDALESWRWLVGSKVQPRLLTAMGDLFVIKHGLFGVAPVFLLDSTSGGFRKVARSWKSLKKRIASPDSEVSEWLKYGLHCAIHATQGDLKEGCCYSSKIPPILGGDYAPQNFESMSWRVHLDIMGQIHQQVKHLPLGTPISSVAMR